MEVHFCDICDSVLKPGTTKYILGVTSEIAEGSKNKENYYENLLREHKKLAKVHLYEICEDCRKIVKYLFQARKSKIKKLKEDVEKTFNKKPYRKKKKREGK